LLRVKWCIIANQSPSKSTAATKLGPKSANAIADDDAAATADDDVATITANDDAITYDDVVANDDVATNDGIVTNDDVAATSRSDRKISTY